MIKNFLDSKLFSKYFIVFFFFLNILFLIHKFILSLNDDVFSDDSYYYILTAINYIKHGFFTFDTINHTNGFHPLFEWILALFFTIVGINHTTYYLYVVTLVFLCTLFIIFLITMTIYAHNSFKNNKANISTYVFLVLLSFLLWRFINVYLNGMESILVIIFVFLLSLSLVNQKYLLSSLIAMFLVSARLDTLVYFITPLFLFFVIQERKKEETFFYTVKFFILLMLPSIIFTISYMFYNYINFEHLKPIHGALKSTFPHLNPQLFLIYSKKFLILFGLALTGIVLLIKRKNIDKRLQTLGISFGVITFIYILNFYLFQKWSKEIPEWYYGILYFTSFGSFFIGISNIINFKILKSFSFLFLLSTIVFTGAKTLSHSYKLYSNESIHISSKNDLFDYIKKLPDESILAYTDNGKISFWGEKNIINLDGLINNYEYQEYLNKNEFTKYLEVKNVDYIIAGIWDRKIIDYREYEPMYKYRVNKNVFEGNYKYLEYYVYSYLYNHYSDKLILHKCAEVFRSRIRQDGNVLSKLIIYDLHKNKLCNKNK